MGLVPFASTDFGAGSERRRAQHNSNRDNKRYAKNLLMIDPRGILHLIGSLYPRTNGGLVTDPHGTVIASDTVAVARFSLNRIQPIASFGGTPYRLGIGVGVTG
jgi:hypothetical protein